MRLTGLTLTGRDPSRAMTFHVNALLAPMDGVTDRTFRNLVLDLGDAGGACTEFVRISVAAWKRGALAKELGPPHPAAPVGLQLMAPSTDHLARTAGNAESAGAPWIDLNFGCPVKRVFNKCAGSALLAYPDRVGAIVAEAVQAVGVPVTAKIRAGVEDDGTLLDVLDACADAGAAAVILHARLRTQSYATPARWEWIRAAVEHLGGRTPLIGNGGIGRAEHVHRMLAETGCAGVMVGRGAIANPWIFRQARGGPAATRDEAVAFALRYLATLCPPGGSKGGLARMKQLIRAYAASGLFEGREHDRVALLRSHEPEAVRSWFTRCATTSLPVRP